jgi:hypothetical protein
MSTDTKILREYLLAIGFRVNESEGKKADDIVSKWSKRVEHLGKALVATATGAAAMVASFTSEMEKLYYASKLADASAGNLKALDFGGRKVGLAAGRVTEAVIGMARALRSNPGLQGLIESFGIQVTGRDKADVMLDFVEHLKSLPPYIAQQYAALFGIDPDTLLLMEQGLDDLRQAAALRKKMAADAGVDMEAAAQAGKEYANSLRDVTERVGLLKDALAIRLLPVFREVSGVMVENLKDWTTIIEKWRGWGDFASRLVEGIFGKVGGTRAVLTPEAAARVRAGETLPPTGAGGGRGFMSPGGLAAPSPGLFDALEARYGLPSGLLDRMWNQESGRGRAMKSPKGAKGHFGFMDSTAQEYGLSDPNDLSQAAGAAARYMHDLLAHYGGDLTHALAAYNWGMGNVDRKGLGALPAETLGYVQQVGGGLQMSQSNTYNIYGSDAASTAQAVGQQQRSNNADLVRNLGGVVR